jgi:hypothetical protein
LETRVCIGARGCVVAAIVKPGLKPARMITKTLE